MKEQSSSLSSSVLVLVIRTLISRLMSSSILLNSLLNNRHLAYSLYLRLREMLQHWRESQQNGLTCMPLTYLFRKATKEVKHFNKEKLIDKIAMEQDEILFSRNRMLDTMNFAEMGDLGLRDLPVMGLKPIYQFLIGTAPWPTVLPSTYTGM